MTATTHRVCGVPQPSDSDARRRYLDLLDPPPKRYPDPQVPGTIADEDDIPASARAWRAKAQAHGWTVTVTYARGTKPDQWGRPGRVIQSLALRMRHPDGRRAVALWQAPEGAGKWGTDTVYAWGPGRWPRSITLTQSRVDPDREHLTGYLAS
jgi:hypothetical protein